MSSSSTFPDPHLGADSPSGTASLRARQRYLRRRSQRRRLGDRSMTAVWVAVGAAVGWLFVLGFATLAH